MGRREWREGAWKPVLDSGADQQGAPLNPSWVFPQVEVVPRPFMFHCWTQTAVAKVPAQSMSLIGLSDLCSSVPLSSDSLLHKF